VDRGAFEFQATSPAHGDLNCHGLINVFDIDPFVVALTDPTAYAVTHPGLRLSAGRLQPRWRRKRLRRRPVHAAADGWMRLAANAHGPHLADRTWGDPRLASRSKLSRAQRPALGAQRALAAAPGVRQA